MNSSDGICAAVFIIETQYFDTGGGKKFALRTSPTVITITALPACLFHLERPMIRASTNPAGQ
ncbi:hypothetical protein [Paraburkholderia aspalathi]|uniref:hypothetical protein n=1 Tax=Paraburkholderia aspalathi TaxID=1324617 RepID=UPI001ABF8C8C|nr:hypothetical protein [Paraburkholderia aspalathi]